MAQGGAGAEQHYEVLARGPAGWALVLATADRKAALDHADILSSSGDYAQVTVVLSLFDPDIGVFRETELGPLDWPTGSGRRESAVQASATVAARGRRAASASTDHAVGRACSSPDDLYSPDARRTISALLAPQLNAWKITPLELLHLPSHARRLHNAGTVMQGAVQKAAIALAPQGTQPAAAIVKQLYDIIGTATRRLQLETSEPPSDSERCRFTMLAKALSVARTWEDKIECLFAETPEAPTDQDLTPIDRITAEMLALSGGLAAVLGANTGRSPTAPEGGGAVVRPPLRPLIAVVTDLLDLLDPYGAPPDAKATGVGMRRLLALLRHGRLPGCSDALLERVAQELARPRLLTGPSDTQDPECEARAIGDIAARAALLAGPPGRVAVSAILVALETRSAALLRSDSLEGYLGTNPASNVALLLTLSGHLVGRLNQTRIAKHLLVNIASADAASRLADTSRSGVLGQMRRLTTWQEEVGRSSFPLELRERIMSAIDRVCQSIVDKANLYTILSKKRPNPLDQALAIVDLAETRALTAGEALNTARLRANACIESAGGHEVFVETLFERSLSFEKISAISRFFRLPRHGQH